MNQQITNDPQLPTVQWLKEQVKGKIILRGDDGYDMARLGWNRRVQQFPAIIVGAESAHDIQAAVDYARMHNLRIAVQGTGHGNIRPADDYLLITTKGMDAVSIDPEAQTAYIEAGVKWGAVLAAAQQHGLAPLLGSSPTVGAVGYTLGGGLGWLARKYGLAADQVQRFEVITADGHLRNVSATENEDLFWGLRGAGNSLAIVASMVIRLVPVTQVYAGNLFYPADMAVQVFRRYRKWIDDQPEEMTSSVLVMNFPPLPFLPDFLRGQTFTIVRGCFCGPIKEGEGLLRYWRTWQQPVIDDFKEIPFSQAAVISNDPEDPMPAMITGAWLRDLSDDAIDTITSFALGQGGPSPLLFAEVRHVGGALGRVSPDSNAFGNRDAGLVFDAIGVVPTPEALQGFVAYTDRMKEALQPSLTGGVYMNFLEGEEAHERLRDGLVPGGYERLVALKAKYDPGNLLQSGALL